MRLAQLTSLYTRKTGLFSEILNAKNNKDFYRFFEVEVSEFWENHYTFQKLHKPKKKPLTISYIDLIIINTLILLKFVKQKCRGKIIMKRSSK
ncbi:DUF2851 family protein [Salinimicrobium marinum]|uniref:DUF2851 family protein n=1 Tax=Salinimicrobium marinum TaxID=680283 RepID=UPI00167C25F5